MLVDTTPRARSAGRVPISASEGWQLAYIKSRFDGQLPSKFAPVQRGRGYVTGLRQQLAATRAVDDSYNSFNREVPSRYLHVSECHFLVDRSSQGEMHASSNLPFPPSPAVPPFPSPGSNVRCPEPRHVSQNASPPLPSLSHGAPLVPCIHARD